MIGSGNLTHNLRDFQRALRPGRQWPGPRQASSPTGWPHAAGDVPALLITAARPGGVQAHPSDEHLLLFYVALGAAGEARRQNVFMPASITT